MTTARRLCHACASLVCALAAVVQPGAASQEPQRPPFRTGTNLVRVDAYPTRDGRIIEGLTAADFEVLEDGVPQRIDSFEFVRFPQNTPSTERRDPNSQRDGFALAADPTYRVFAIYLDNLHVDFGGSHQMRVPLITFLNQVLGPKDLFGVMTTAQRPQDLVLGQKTDFIEEQLTKHWDWGRGARVLEDDEDMVLSACYPKTVADELVARRRMDEVFSDLEGLMATLAAIREERKNILLVSNGWALPRRASWTQAAVRPALPGIGVTDAGKLTAGATRRGEVDPRMCDRLRQHLADMDFQERLRELLRLARESNVTFYTINPGGLSPFDDRARVDSLRTLSENTDGLAVVNTNDLTGGARQIAQDLSAMYLLGYSSTNPKPDGRLRRITVRLKGSRDAVRARREYRAPTTAEIAAMRSPAPAAGSPAAAATPVDAALAELKRLRPAAVLHTRAAVVANEMVLATELAPTEIEAGRWKSGGDVQVILTASGGDVVTTARGRIDAGQRSAVIRMPLTGASGPFNAAVQLRSASDGEARDAISVQRRAGLLGDALVFRLAGGGAPRAAGSVHFRRTERVQARWPLTGAPEDLRARLLGRDGVPLDLPVTPGKLEENGVGYVVVDLNLAPLTAGEYVLEISARGADGPTSSHLAFRVFR